jgi:SAM-dependent methyltransferase
MVGRERVMASSNSENRDWILNKVSQLQPKTVIDVGAGSGTYCRLLRPYAPANYAAIEIYQKNITQYKLLDLYDDVWLDDVRNFKSLQADLIIFGDVLEHMTKEEAIKVWDVASKGCKYAILSIPIIHYPQGVIDGNHHETHIVDDWNNISVFESFKNIVECKLGAETGAYLAKF